MSATALLFSFLFFIMVLRSFNVSIELYLGPPGLASRKDLRRKDFVEADYFARLGYGYVAAQHSNDL